MTTVLCDETSCKHNHDGVCQQEVIHIVCFRKGLDCARFERDWRKQYQRDHAKPKSEG